MTLKVTHHDNRGDAETPYGFVYFNDDSRLGYPDLGCTLNDDGTYTGFFKTKWEKANPTTPLHFKLANEYLRAQEVKGYEI